MEAIIIQQLNINIIQKSEPMHYHPKLNSPLNSSSYLKNSRISERSTEGDRSFKVNRSFDFENSFIDSSADKPNNLSVISVQRNHTADTASHLPKKGGQEIKRNFLARVLINRMLNIRAALKIMQSLPIKIFKKGPSFSIAKEIVLRAKPNIETSILRTLVFAEEQRAGRQGKLKCTKGQDVFVMPVPAKRSEELKKRALIDLVEIAKIPMKRAVKAFQAHGQQQQVLARYFRKVLANQWKNIENAFSKFKQLPTLGTSSKARSQLAHSQLKILCKTILSKHINLMEYSFAIIKSNSVQVRLRQEGVARQIIAFSKMKKEICIREWLAETRISKITEKKEAQVEEQKLNALTRIVQRNYLKLFMEIVRRCHNFQVVAHRIGCNSKINEQKSMWRLLAHMQKRLREERLNLEK